MLLLLACAEPTTKPTDDVVDLRMDFVDPPAGGIQLATPDLEVAPYSEIIYCYYGTYSGPEAGVNYMAPLSAEGITHHNQLKAVYDDAYPDGTLIECPEENNGMAVYAPLFESVGYPSPGGAPPDIPDTANWINLPDGVAMRLGTGQRWVMDVHYVNTTADTVMVNAAINLGLVPADEVEVWAGAIQFDVGELQIPPQQDTSITFDCTWEQSYTLLSLMGHLHDRGTSYTVDWLGEQTTRIYEVDPWGPEYREYPRIEAYADGEFQVQPGDVFRTTCAWTNDTDETLTFPSEMCTTVMVAYPLDAPLSCFGAHVE